MDLGVVGHKGVMEKDLSLVLTGKIQKHLTKSGITSFLTRTTDETMPLSLRSNRTARGNADLFVSIHANSAGAAQQGMEALCLNKGKKAQADYGHPSSNRSSHEKCEEEFNNFLTNNVDRSHRLAHVILSNTINHVKKENITIKNRGLKCNAWQVLLHNMIPSTILEVGFLTSPHEGALLLDGAYQELLTYGIAQGIIRFMTLEKML